MNNQNFRLNDDAKKRIDDEFQSPIAEQKKGKKSLFGKKARAEEDTADTEEVTFEDAYDTGFVDDFYKGDSKVKRKPKKHRLRKVMAITAIVCVIVILLNIAFFYYRGQIWFNEPRKRDYAVRGAVVSQDLGEIDWSVMSQQSISFTYIRATKGTTSVDSEFESNRTRAIHTDLLVGCWHEFDFRTDGEKQAENYINECGDMSGMLCPMVKVTKYGIYNLHMKNADDVRENLQKFIDRIEEEYGWSPVIMCDSASYKKYIEPYFDDYAVWIIDHFDEPDEDIDWSLWDFNPRVRSEGYENSKKYFCMSVYRKGEDLENFKLNMQM
jgi:lysozyme